MNRKYINTVDNLENISYNIDLLINSKEFRVFFEDFLNTKDNWFNKNYYIWILDKILWINIEIIWKKETFDFLKVINSEIFLDFLENNFIKLKFVLELNELQLHLKKSIILYIKKEIIKKTTSHRFYSLLKLKDIEDNEYGNTDSIVLEIINWQEYGIYRNVLNKNDIKPFHKVLENYRNKYISIKVWKKMFFLNVETWEQVWWKYDYVWWFMEIDKSYYFLVKDDSIKYIYSDGSIYEYKDFFLQGTYISR